MSKSFKIDEVASSGNDEYYTPEYAISPLIQYLKDKEFKTIWCPFDTERSHYVKMLTAEGFEVINTHLDSGDDFFFMIPPECDCIVSNPPYSIRTQIIERLYNIGKPFAMLLGVVGLFESQKRFDMFSRFPVEVMYFDKRIAYFRSYEDQKPSFNPPFSSVYLCSEVLPQQMIFEKIVR